MNFIEAVKLSIMPLTCLDKLIKMRTSKKLKYSSRHFENVQRCKDQTENTKYF